MKSQNFPFYILFLFILFISACHISNKASSTTSPHSQYQTTCQKDSDCVLVDKDCCGCSAGGESIAINKSQEIVYNKDLDSRCSGDSMRVCPAWFRCREFQAKCHKSKCIVIKNNLQ